MLDSVCLPKASFDGGCSKAEITGQEGTGMTRVAASRARVDFAELLNTVAFRRQRTVVHRHGRDLAALVPMQDLKLLQALEDKLDIEAAHRALAEKGSVSLAELKESLGLGKPVAKKR
jgi:prevent-host-death family protein